MSSGVSGKVSTPLTFFGRPAFACTRIGVFGQTARISLTISIMRSMPLPAGEGFAWCAAEAATAAGLREVLAAKGLPKEAMRVAAYWKRGASGHHAELAE